MKRIILMTFLIIAMAVPYSYAQMHGSMGQGMMDGNTHYNDSAGKNDRDRDEYGNRGMMQGQGGYGMMNPGMMGRGGYGMGGGGYGKGPGKMGGGVVDAGIWGRGGWRRVGGG